MYSAIGKAHKVDGIQRPLLSLLAQPRQSLGLCLRNILRRFNTAQKVNQAREQRFGLRRSILPEINNQLIEVLEGFGEPSRCEDVRARGFFQVVMDAIAGIEGLVVQIEPSKEVQPFLQFLHIPIQPREHNLFRCDKKMKSMLSNNTKQQ